MGLYREHDSSIKVVPPAISVTIVSNVVHCDHCGNCTKLQAEPVKVIAASSFAS